MGVEEELQLVDPQSGRLEDRPDELGSTISASDGQLQTEIFRSTIETATPICADVAEVGNHMRRLRAEVVEAGRVHGLAVAASGTHPFAAWEAQAKTDAPRYNQLVRDLRFPAERDLVFGQHVHVSVGSPEEAIGVTNDIQAFLPLLLALSGNAPFWRGIDTGLQSARVNVSAGMPRSGLPPSFSGWAEFETHLARLRQAGVLEDVTKLWWDVRPRPELGTVEVRIADLPTEIETSIALAALTQALVVDLARRFRREERPATTSSQEVVQENRWRALRYGLEAQFIDPTPVGRVRLHSVERTFARTATMLAPTVRSLGVEDEIGHLRDRVEQGRSGADRQRAVYQEDADMAAVVQDLADRTPP